MRQRQAHLFPRISAAFRISEERGSEARFAAGAALLALASLLAIAPVFKPLVLLWSDDALRSMGMLFPILSFALTMRAWRQLGWEAKGTWWGVALMGGAAAAGYAGHRFQLNFASGEFFLTLLPHNGLTLYAYASGLALAAGGRRLWRAAALPLALLLFVNPFPLQLSSLFDLPLQRISAHTAWLFARAIGQQPGADQLRLMFAPDFGMFIAPGCNGIRGALTMGYMALILGYLNRFRGRALALAVVAAVALGYVFNLARLCLLVLFYRVAMHSPWLQDRATAADYAIGSCLFFTAMALFAAALRIGRREAPAPVASASEETDERPAGGLMEARWKAAAVGVFGLCGLLAYPHALADIREKVPSVPRSASAALPSNFPYAVSRVWNERYLGKVYYDWVDYSPAAVGGAPGAAADDGLVVHVGMGPDKGWHDTLVCHRERDEFPTWASTVRATTADGDPVSFHATFYDDGATRLLEANTACDAKGCAEADHSAGPFVLEMKPTRLAARDSEQNFPVLIRIESTDTTTRSEAVRERLLEDLRGFVEKADLSVLNRAQGDPAAIAGR